MKAPAASRKAILEHTAAALRRIAAPYEGPITEATELYYDLGLAGDDLYDAIQAIREPFGTDLRLMDLRRYAPNEVGHNFGLNLVRWMRELSGKRTYCSLTVDVLVRAIEAGAWNDR